MTSYFKYRGLDYKDGSSFDITAELNRNALEPIIDSYFWLPTIDGLNDPFEGIFVNNLTTEMHQFTAGVSLQEKQLLHLHFVELARKLHEFTKVSGIFSLSKSYQSELMWAHYGASHYGICIEYDLDHLTRLVYKESLHKFSVDYDSKPPQIGINDVSKDNAGAIKLRLGWKSDPWSYEEEYRVVCDGMSGKVPTDYSAVKSVTFGARCPEWLIDEVIELTKNKVPTYYQTQLGSESYSLGRSKVKELQIPKIISSSFDKNMLISELESWFNCPGNEYASIKVDTILKHIQSDPHYDVLQSAGDSTNRDNTYFVAYKVKHDAGDMTVNTQKVYFDKSSNQKLTSDMLAPEPQIIK